MLQVNLLEIFNFIEKKIGLGLNIISIMAKFLYWDLQANKNSNKKAYMPSKMESPIYI